jgi:catechol 2,3-dioxygenase-like lactoylglutathione lyase family enzyme
MLPQRLSVVILGARDLDRLRAFYSSFGWRPRPRQGMFSRFDLAGTALMLFPLDTLEQACGLQAPPEGTFRGTANAMVVGSDAEANDILSAVKGAAGQVLTELETRSWGVRTGYFADPELNVWEVAVLDGATFDDRGALVWPGS